MKVQSIISWVVIVSSFLLSTTVFAQKTETRQFNSFNSVKIGGNFDVIIQQGSTPNVQITASGVDSKEIITEMRGDELVIRMEDDRWNWKNSYEVDIVITYTTLNGITSSGSSSVVTKSTIKSDNFKLRLSGSGKLKVKVETDELEASLSGSGDIELSGKAKRQDISISGSGDIEALDLSTNSTKISISGSGNAKVAVSEEIEAKVSGSGDIRYQGSPSKQIVKTTGSGSVRKI